MSSKAHFLKTSTCLFFLLLFSLGQVGCSLYTGFFPLQSPSSTGGGGNNSNDDAFVVPTFYAPQAISHLGSLQTFVHGPNLTSYKFKIGLASSTSCADEAGYSMEIPIQTPINQLLTVDNTDYRACVIGKTNSGLWTPYSNASSSTWFKDARMSLPFGLGGSFGKSVYDGSGTLYTIMGFMGVIVYDVSDLTDFKVVGVYETQEGYAQDLILSGNTLYVAHNNDGLGVFTNGQIDIVDVSDRTKPRKINFVTTASSPSSLKIAGGHLYSGEHSHLEIFELSNPLAPMVVGQVGTPSIREIQVSGNFAYLAGGGHDLRIFDVTTPSTPTLIGSYIGAGSGSNALALAGTTAFVTTSSGHTRAIDISDPGAPVLLSSLNTGKGQGIKIRGTHAIVGGAATFTILNISNPAALSTLGTVMVGEFTSDVLDLGTDFLLTSSNKLSVYDLSIPATPTLHHLEQGFGGDWANSIYADDEDHYVYLGDRNSLVTLDITNRSHPRLVRLDPSLADAHDIKKKDDFLYVVTSSGLTILDVKNPQSYSVAGSWATGLATYTGIDFSGNKLILTGDSELFILDVTDPMNVALHGNINLGCTTANLVAFENLGFVGCGNQFKIVDITNTSAPTVVSTTMINVEDLATSGDYLYIVGGSTTVDIYDITNPAAPALTASVEPASMVASGYSTAYGVEYRDGFIYVADWDYVSIIDVRTPLNPTLISSYNIGPTWDQAIWRVWPTKTSLMIADGNAGFRLIHIGDPTLPQAK